LADSHEEELHWVRASSRQRGYWRRKPYIYRNPTRNQRRARYELARIAHDIGREQWGTVTLEDGRVIPASAIPIMENMRPVTEPKPPTMYTWGGLTLEDIRKILVRAVPTAPPSPAP